MRLSLTPNEVWCCPGNLVRKCTSIPEPFYSGSAVSSAITGDHGEPVVKRAVGQYQRESCHILFTDTGEFRYTVIERRFRFVWCVKCHRVVGSDLENCLRGGEVSPRPGRRLHQFFRGPILVVLSNFMQHRIT